MGFNILPGVLCALTNALPSDAGTLVLGASQPPGATGRGSDETILAEDEREWIKKAYGKKADGTLMDLGSLMLYRDQSIREYESAVSQYGPRSRQARWQEATVAHFEGLIKEARARRGDATAKLCDAIKGSAGGGGEGRKTEIKAAIDR